MVTVEHIQLAQERLKPYLLPTPLEPAPDLPNVWLKLENANRTHSFKVRGALNAMLSLSPDERARGVVTASSGNHAQGIAYAAHLLDTKARVLMPENVAKRKAAGVRRWGADAVLYGDSYDETEIEARRVERDEGLTYISPYNDARVIAGAGTVGLEIAAALPDLARVIVPVGGGGLISGIGTVIKTLKPSAQVIGVNPAASPDMYNVFYRANLPTSHDTLADALPGDVEAGSITRDLVRTYVDSIVLVSEDAIADAMRWMLGEAGWLVEGGGAVGVAALLSRVIELIDGATAIVVSGGNVDLDVLRRIAS